MTSLETLDISDTEISDLTPLSGLACLHTVKARQIKANMAPLERLGASLRVLELKGSTVAPSMTPLVQVLPALVNLERLSLQPPDHETIEAVSTLMHLQELTLRTYRGLTHAAPLGTLAHLTKLRLGVRSIRIMVALGTLDHLKELAIEVRSHEHTEAYEFRFMKGMTALERLELTSVDAISRMSNAIPCTGLRTLKLKCFHTYVQQELPEKLLRKNPKLRILIIEDSSYLEYSLREIDALAAMSQLEHLRVATASKLGGRLSRFWKPLECLTNLQRLELVHAKMQDFTQLRGMTQLVELRFEYGGLRDFAGIEALLSLEVLGFKGSSLPDVTPLRWLKRLRRLVLSPEADCTPVAHDELPCLVELIHPWLNCLGWSHPPHGIVSGIHESGVTTSFNGNTWIGPQILGLLVTMTTPRQVSMQGLTQLFSIDTFCYPTYFSLITRRIVPKAKPFHPPEACSTPSGLYKTRQHQILSIIVRATASEAYRHTWTLPHPSSVAINQQLSPYTRGV